MYTWFTPKGRYLTEQMVKRREGGPGLGGCMRAPCRRPASLPAARQSVTTPPQQQLDLFCFRCAAPPTCGRRNRLALDPGLGMQQSRMSLMQLLFILKRVCCSAEAKRTDMAGHPPPFHCFFAAAHLERLRRAAAAAARCAPVWRRVAQPHHDGARDGGEHLAAAAERTGLGG